MYRLPFTVGEVSTVIYMKAFKKRLNNSKKKRRSGLQRRAGRGVLALVQPPPVRACLLLSR